MDAIEELLADIGNYIGNLFSRIGNSIKDAFSGVVDYLGSLINSITNSLTQVVNNLAEVIGDIFGKIQDFISTTIEKVVAFIDEMLNGIIDQVVSFIQSAVDTIKNLYTNVLESIKDMFNKVTTYLGNLYDKVVSQLIDVTNKVTDYFSDLFERVVTQLSDIVDRVKLFLGDLFTVVKDGINELIVSAATVVESITQAIQTFINEVVDTVGGSLRDLLETISELPGDIEELASKIVESAQENIAQPLTDLPLNLLETFNKMFSKTALRDVDEMEIQSLNMMFGSLANAKTPESMRTIVSGLMPKSPILKALIVAIVSPLMIIQLASGVARANTDVIAQEYALDNPSRLLEPPDAVRAMFFGLRDEVETVTTLRKHGYTESDAATMLLVAETVPPEGELINWFLRGFIDEGKLRELLRKKGWDLESINALIRAAFFIPPVQDLVTMAVREVFSPATAEKFGQFEDFPAEFAQFANQQGISEEWAKRYWAAHWALPSVQMGYEMLHREVITQEELNMLLKAADVMPFWRERLIEISYSPLTRVDIRRMHDEGILTVDEVNKAYRDIGYNEVNAKRLTDFTIKLNAPKVADDPDDLTTLTRSNIIGLYKDGVLDRQSTKTLLINIGLSDAATELLLISVDIDIDRAERQEQIDIIIQRAANGLIGFDEAQHALNALDLQEREKAIALNKLAKLEAKQNKLPSKGDLDKMFTKNIINQAVYRDTMRRIGYGDTWIDNYLKLLGAG